MIKSLHKEFKKMLEELDKLKLPLGEYLIISSGALAVRGIRQASDLDILVSNKLWDQTPHHPNYKSNFGSNLF